MAVYFQKSIGTGVRTAPAAQRCNAESDEKQGGSHQYPSMKISIFAEVIVLNIRQKYNIKSVNDKEFL